MAKLIVLTCASGKQCSKLIPLLYKDPNYSLRLVVHTQQSNDRLRTLYPEAEVISADLELTSDWANIINGASILYYVPPTGSPKEAYLGINAIDAAVSEANKLGTQFSHFIFSSVIHPEISKMLNHDRKRYVEEYLTESGLPYTILQPCRFIENSIYQLVEQKDTENPVFKIHSSPTVKFSFTSLDDYAEASARVIKDREAHLWATYQLVSTLPISYTEYAAQVESLVSKKFKIEVLPVQQMTENLLQSILGTTEVPQAVRDVPERMLFYYTSRGLVANPGIMKWLIGREPTSPADLFKILVNAKA